MVNGNAMDVSETLAAMPVLPRIRARSSSSPTMNMKMIRPRPAMTVRNGRTSIGNTRRVGLPGKSPSNEGPRARPAKISATTTG